MQDAGMLVGMFGAIVIVLQQNHAKKKEAEG